MFIVFHNHNSALHPSGFQALSVVLTPEHSVRPDGHTENNVIITSKRRRDVVLT